MEVHQSAKNYIYKLWKNIRMFPNKKMWRLWISDDLRDRISNDLKNLEKSLSTKDKTKNSIGCLWFLVLRQHCTKNRHDDSIIEITARAQAHFLQSLSVNTVHCASCKCRLKRYHEKRMWTLWKHVQKPAALTGMWHNVHTWYEWDSVTHPPDCCRLYCT